MLPIFALLLLAQNGQHDGLTEAQREHKLAIEREWGEPNMPEWAGPWTGEGVIAPRNGYFFAASTHLGPIVDTGTIIAEGRRLILRDDEAPHHTGASWYIPWGERTYLIEEHRMPEFCIQVNDGREPRFSVGAWPTMRPSDYLRQATGKPEVPSHWLPLLLDRPIHAVIVGIEQRRIVPRRDWQGNTLTRFTLHKGRRDGVVLDLGFHLGRRGRIVATVEQVDQTACVVRLLEHYEGDELPKVGSLATTDLPR